MQESPEYIMGLKCGAYPETRPFKIIMSSLTVNGIEHLSSPTYMEINAINVNWVRANNNIVYDCTLGNPTGWTYTNFVDFLNYTFSTCGLNYEARLSYETINVRSNSVAGFYLIYPENDVFSIKTISEADGGGTGLYRISYENGRLTFWEDYSMASPTISYYQATNEYFNYDCETNTITE